MKERFVRIAQGLIAEEYAMAAKKCLSDLIPVLLAKYEELFDEKADTDDRLDIRVSEDGLPDGKVGAYKVDDDGKHGVMTINPGAFTGEKAPYWFVIAHELIHLLLKNPEEPHGEDFNALADSIGLPERYRN